MTTPQPYKGVFEKMEREGKFPPYVYKEYPKWVELKNGQKIIVNSQVEELRAIDEIVPVTDVKKLEADKANVEKLLAESEARMAELKAKLEGAKENELKKVEEPSKVAPPTTSAKPVLPAPSEAPSAKTS